MSSESQDYVFEVDWGDIAAPEPVAPAPIPVAQPALPPANPLPVPPPLPAVSPAPQPPPSPATPAQPAPAARSVVRGQRLKLSEFGINDEVVGIGVQIAHPPGETLDITCLGLDAQSRLSDDRYFIFFNQKSSPAGELTLLGPSGAFQQVFRADLSRLPLAVERIAIVAAFENDGTMRSLGSSRLALLDGERCAAEFVFSGGDFGTERALIIAEIYRRDGAWRFAAAGQGFGGGLAALLRHYGAQVAE